MTDLTFTIFRYAFLILLWVMVYFVVHSLYKDIETLSPHKSFGHHMRDRKAQKAAKAPAPAASPLVAGRHRPSGGMHSAAPTLLTVLDGPAAGASVPLKGSTTITLGRSSSNTVVLDDEFVSSHHARVYLDPVSQAWAIEDLNSTNGTVVDHHRISNPVTLQAGVPVRIGSTTIELR